VTRTPAPPLSTLPGIAQKTIYCVGLGTGERVITAHAASERLTDNVAQFITPGRTLIKL